MIPQHNRVDVESGTNQIEATLRRRVRQRPLSEGQSTTEVKRSVRINPHSKQAVLTAPVATCQDVRLRNGRWPVRTHRRAPTGQMGTDCAPTAVA